MNFKVNKTLTACCIVLAVGLAFSGCKKDKVDDGGLTASGHTVSVKFHHFSGASAFAFNTNYLDDFGNIYQFSSARMYISGIMLRDDGGTAVNCFDKYLLISPDSTNAIVLGTTSAAHIHTIDMNVGVDSVTNHSDPAQWPASHPLAPQSPSMHWGWSMGYIFFMLEGTVDTDGNGISDSPVQFHVGTDDFLRNSGNIMMHTDVTGDITLELDVDWANFFSGIDLSTDNSTHTGDNVPLATAAADNVPLLFTAH